MILDYLGGPSVITKLLKSGRGRQRRESERWQHGKDSPKLLTLKIRVTVP